MKALDDSVVLRGGRFDGYQAMVDFAGYGDVDVIAVGSGRDATLYRFIGGEWRHDPRGAGSIKEFETVATLPSPYEFEATRSLSAGTSTSSSGMAGLAAELRSIGAVFDAELQATKDHLRRRTTWRVYAMTEWGASDSELQAEIDRLNLEIKLATRQSIRRRQLEMEAKRVEYAKPMGR